ncbi:argonaute-like protein [Wolfiporia cocos MD-104 SS10]|uniref:Argonaute-like protein n=1 Tax=Wolfiporia cocos (strain MD-104) TaxID=742152 RepID=A0A2H3IWR4_WOLCO|nr:argonaute-like protein [Wolfiporia cocos MD-104 SS10]
MLSRQCVGYPVQRIGVREARQGTFRLTRAWSKSGRAQSALRSASTKSTGFNKGRGPPGGRNGPPGGSGGGDRGRGGRGGFSASRQAGGVFMHNVPAKIDARLANDSQDALVKKLRSSTLSDTDLPARPDFGTVGRLINLRTNYFPVSLPKGPLFEYDVAISPPMRLKRVRRRIFQQAEQTSEWKQAGMLGRVAHDNASRLISCFELPQPLEIKLQHRDVDGGKAKSDGPQRAKKNDDPGYTMIITYQRELETESLRRYLDGDPQYRDYDPMPVISAMNIVLAAWPDRPSGPGMMIGKNRFFAPSDEYPARSLGSGLEAWRGFYASVRPTYRQLMVNVNVCTTAFYTPGNLMERMYEFMKDSPGNRVASFVSGLRVKTTHLGYTKTIKTVSKFNAREYRFTTEEYGEVSVEKYFRLRYKISLRFPNEPLLDVGGSKQEYIPAELCVIHERQPFRGRLSENSTANMITFACQPPNVNGQAIMERGLVELGYKQRTDTLAAFGVSIGTNMAVVPGRILPAPALSYGSGKPVVDDERAGWNLRDIKFNVGGKLDKLAVLVIKDGGRNEFSGRDDRELRSVVEGLLRMCRKLGMQVAGEPIFAEVTLPRRSQKDPTRTKAAQEIGKALESIKSKAGFVLVVLSDSDRHVYNGIKYMGDVQVGIPTFCVISSKIRKEIGQMQYLANVALKINMKTGGVNHTLHPESMAWFQQAPTMLVGMDVTHPGSGAVKGTTSIAAMVASVDSKFGQFPASLRLQGENQEIITDVASMMQERIAAFKQHSKTLPERILIYRDGISEGEMATVIVEEVLEVKKAFTKFSTPEKPYSPKVTFISCGKRHNTRFYPTKADDADRLGNPRPGTVVDRGVTAVYDFDFYLQAHGGLQGSTRPTHYYVLYDENGFNADTIQGLTNNISYMFARATKAVSLVSPAYYADLACERGRCYLHPLLQGISANDANPESDPEETREKVAKEAAELWQGGLKGKMAETMFYI